MNKTVKSSLIYLSGTIAMGLLGFLSTMLLTRMVSQQVYAMYGLLTTFVTVADMFVAFGYDQSYMRFYYKHNRSPLGFLWECVKVPLIIFCLFAVVLLEPGQHLIRYIFEDKLGFYVILGITGQIFFSSISRFSQLTARMSEHAGNYVISGLIGRSGFIVLLAVFVWVLGDVSFGLVVLSNVIMAIVSVGVTGLVFRKIGNKKNPEGVPVTNGELVKYGFPYMLNSVIVLLVPMLEKVIIRDLAGWEVLSIYTAASIFQTVVLLLVNTLNNIWNPMVYQNCDDEEKFKPILHTFGLVGAIVMVLGTAACILLRRWLVLLLDAKYYTVYIIAPVILLSACFNILSVIYAVGINISKKTIHFVIAPILQIIVSLLLCYLLIPGMGLSGVALAVLSSIGIAHFYRIFVGLRLYGTGVSEIKTFLLCGVCVAGAVSSLFLTDLMTDVLLSVGLLIAMVVIINKDIVPVARSVIALVKPNKKNTEQS